jgi:hypothetical protein
MKAPPSPFERLLGTAFENLPAPVRYLHALRQPTRTSGRADVTVATGVVVSLICWFAGLPRPGHDIDVSVTFTPDGSGGERWERQFADRRYTSAIAADEGKEQKYLIEYFSLFRLQFALTARPDRLEWSLAGWRLGALPLPRWSLPHIDCVEGADGERFTFDIDVTFPLVGPLIRYHGWLLPQNAGDRTTNTVT